MHVWPVEASLPTTTPGASFIPRRPAVAFASFSENIAIDLRAAEVACRFVHPVTLSHTFRPDDEARFWVAKAAAPFESQWSFSHSIVDSDTSRLTDSARASLKSVT